METLKYKAYELSAVVKILEIVDLSEADILVLARLIRKYYPEIEAELPLPCISTVLTKREATTEC